VAGAPARSEPAAFRRRWSRRTDVWVAVVGWLVAAVARLVYATLRVRVVDDAGIFARHARAEHMVGAFWHETIPLMPLVIARAHYPARVCVLLSWHRDAEIAARAVARFGIRSVHGSSTRGWMGGVRGLLAAARAGDEVLVVPDGPRGPRRRAKEGVVQLARMTGRPIVAFGAAARPVRRLGSWDRMQLPLPFARVAIVTVGPLAVPREGDPAPVLAAVQAALEGASARAASLVGAADEGR
jgi:lysophospholipid acyltransferase (LPLAT)-like uncharacterized protein